MKRNSFLLIWLALSTQVLSQGSFNQTYRFLSHLSDIKSYEEGIYFIDQRTAAFRSPGQLDTLNYTKGLFQYQLRLPEESILSLARVGNSNSQFKLHATFLRSFQTAYIGNYGAAFSFLDTLSFSDQLMNELKIHQLAGLSLLRRDIESFDNYSSQFTDKHFQLSSFQQQLIQNKEGLLKERRKSPLLAGVLSGLVPGAGKFYVGKIGEGYITLLLSTILGLQIREAYKKEGVSSFRFKLFTGLFSTLYVANIWGSVLSVKIYKEDFNETFNEAILLNMHVPIRTIFD